MITSGLKKFAERFNEADITLVDSSKRQVDRLIAAARNPRDKAFIALLARVGIRISEAIQVKESDIDFTNGNFVHHTPEGTREIEMS